MSQQLVQIPEEDEAVPYYQPIISLQTQRVFGYEVLGRKVNGDQVSSLGPFFHNEQIPSSVHVRVDRCIREKAFRRLAEDAGGAQLFINLKPSWIFQQYKETGIFPTLQLMEQYGIPGNRVVIEITEEDFKGNLVELTQAIQMYRAKGCAIAIDDVGSGFSNFDRIALFQPNILKVDLKILKESAKHDGYRALMRSFSILASQIGASLLVEGVETAIDLQNALKAGARFVQGYLFSPGQSSFVAPDAFAALLTEEIILFTAGEYGKYARFVSLEQSLHEAAAGWLSAGGDEEADRFIEQVLVQMRDNCLRIYVCREDGRQVSSNYVKESDGLWKKQAAFRGSNWVWRPYFIHNLLAMNASGKGTLSQAYTDLDSNKTIHTYSCPIGAGYYMFLDVES